MLSHDEQHPPAGGNHRFHLSKLFSGQWKAEVPFTWELYYCSKYSDNVSHVTDLLCLYLYEPFHTDEQLDDL